MAYNETLANRIREKLVDLSNLNEKEMMGGLAFMVNEKMCIGVIKDEMMCRIDPNMHEKAVEKRGCRTMDFTRQQMKGWVMVDETGMNKEMELDYWIGLALDFNNRAIASKKRRS